MATTAYGVNDPNAVKLWAKVLTVEVLKHTWASKFMGDTSASVIQVKDETQKSAGDKITYGLRMQLTGTGIQGDGTLEGNEEALTVYTDAVLINQLRHAVRSAGRMSQQRVPFDVRMEALSGLRDWWTDRIDASFFNQLCGYTVQNDTRYTGNNATVAPDTNHLIISETASTTEGSITTTSTYTLSLIDKAIERARTLTPAIRPVRMAGRDFYVKFLHPYQVTDLRTSTSTGQWLDIQKAAMQGGEIGDNPIFDGSLGMYNGTILHADVRVTNGVSSGAALTNIRRAVLCGAQAIMMAYGRDDGPEQYTWVEQLFDFENQLGVAAGSVFGMKKAVYNSSDYATIVTSCYSASH